MKNLMKYLALITLAIALICQQNPNNSQDVFVTDEKTLQSKFDTKRFDSLFTSETLKLRQGMVAVKVGKRGGAGVIVEIDDKYLYVLTAKHILLQKGQLAIEVLDKNSKSTIIKNISKTNTVKHRKVDLGLIKVPRPEGDFGTIKLAERPVLIGEKIRVVGHPCNIYYAITEGIVSSYKKRKFQGIKEEYIVVSAPSFSGGSGGALINSKGQLAGIVVGIMYIGRNAMDYKNTVYVFHIVYVTKLEFIKDFLYKNGIIMRIQ